MTWGEGWPLWAWLVVNALATYRLTRLAVKDAITQPLRRRLVGMGAAPFEGPLAAVANGPVRLAAYLLTCPWCAGVWSAAGVVALTAFVPLAWSYAAAGLAFATAAGWLSDREL